MSWAPDAAAGWPLPGGAVVSTPLTLVGGIGSGMAGSPRTLLDLGDSVGLLVLPPGSGEGQLLLSGMELAGLAQGPGGAAASEAAPHSLALLLWAVTRWVDKQGVGPGGACACVALFCLGQGWARGPPSHKHRCLPAAPLLLQLTPHPPHHHCWLPAPSTQHSTAPCRNMLPLAGRAWTAPPPAPTPRYSCARCACCCHRPSMRHMLHSWRPRDPPSALRSQVCGGGGMWWHGSNAAMPHACQGHGTDASLTARPRAVHSGGCAHPHRRPLPSRRLCTSPPPTLPCARIPTHCRRRCAHHLHQCDQPQRRWRRRAPASQQHYGLRHGGE